jgi:hypothetical protein
VFEAQECDGSDNDRDDEQDGDDESDREETEERLLKVGAKHRMKAKRSRIITR